MKHKLLSAAFFSAFLLIAPNVKAADFHDNQTVDKNKIWTIEFTGEVGFDDATKQSITVTDSNNNKVNVGVNLGQDPKKVLVTAPKGGYIEGESYTLNVGSKAHSSKGTPIKNEHKLHFNIKSNTTNKEQGNTGGNLSNNGFVVENNGWIYYSDIDRNGWEYTGDVNLFRIKKDGTNKQKLWSNHDIVIDDINVFGGCIYFKALKVGYGAKWANFSIIKIRTDGTDCKYLLDGTTGDHNVISIHSANRNLYGSDSVQDSFFAIDMSDNKRDINNISGGRLIVCGNWILYRSSDGLYKADINGNNNQKISSDFTDYLNFSNNYIYYVNESDKKAYRMDLSGNNKLCLTENDVVGDGLNVIRDWIYFINDSDRFIYRMNLDGTNKQQINNVESQYINITGNKIYFKNISDDSNIYRMNLDGSNIEKLDRSQGSFQL